MSANNSLVQLFKGLRENPDNKSKITEIVKKEIRRGHFTVVENSCLLAVYFERVYPVIKDVVCTLLEENGFVSTQLTERLETMRLAYSYVNTIEYDLSDPDFINVELRAININPKLLPVCVNGMWYPFHKAKNFDNDALKIAVQRYIKDNDYSILNLMARVALKTLR